MIRIIHLEFYAYTFSKEDSTARAGQRDYIPLSVARATLFAISKQSL